MPGAKRNRKPQLLPGQPGFSHGNLPLNPIIILQESVNTFGLGIQIATPIQGINAMNYPLM
jgi:hypothetical protein